MGVERISREQARRFRLHAHHLDTWYQTADLGPVAGACGFQNSPPGAWEAALHNRIPALTRDDMRRLLEEEKTLLQAWSFRGAPVVFPTAESDAFLSALVARDAEPWIYTRGIQLALDALQMPFEEALRLLKQVMPNLEGETLTGKTDLDQTLAGWIQTLLPEAQRERWNSPSMYGNPERQTVGGAVVSFLLRPCAYLGLVVFGERRGISPTFTTYHNWTGHALEQTGLPEQRLVRKYLHCYGPASPGGLADWLGCSTSQARRIWQTVAGELEAVALEGRERYILSEDRALLQSPPPLERPAHLLSGHDPYLCLQDRELILDHRARQRQIWRTVSNPGAVLWKGEVVGIWSSKKQGAGLELAITLWNDTKLEKRELQALGEDYARFQQRKLSNLLIT